MMFGLSKYYGVPVNEVLENMDIPVWENDDSKEFFIPENIRNFNFQILFNQVLNSAKRGDNVIPT